MHIYYTCFKGMYATYITCSVPFLNTTGVHSNKTYN